MTLHSAILLLLLPAVGVAAVGNDSVILPPGASNHGDPRLLCLPARWNDVAFFFLLNYVAHAATVVLEPGASPIETALTVLTALLLPGAGLYNALRNIKLGIQTWGMGDVQRAQKAGALCTSSRYWTNLELYGWQRHIGREFWMSKNPIQYLSAESLPTNVPLYMLPSNVPISLCSHLEALQMPLSRDVLRIIAAMAQVGYGVYTLYDARGDQIDRYGYAAFGLTVAPYAYMSILNGVAGLLMPPFPALAWIYVRGTSQIAPDTRTGTEQQYNDLAECDICCKSTQYGLAYASPAVGSSLRSGREASDPLQTSSTTTVSTDSDHPSSTDYFVDRGHIRLMLITICLGCIPLLVIGVLTKFRAGTMSETSQQGWVLSWTLAGIVAGPLLRYSRANLQSLVTLLPQYFVVKGIALLLIPKDVLTSAMRRIKLIPPSEWEYEPWSRRDRAMSILTGSSDEGQYWFRTIITILLTAIFAVPSIGGMVTTTRMIADYGVCRRLD